MVYRVLSRDEHLFLRGPKRVLSLDGGGIRGVVTLAYLERVEKILKSRFKGDDGFRLCHYFDLIAGTSTGAIIAAGLAKGMKVEELIEVYLHLGSEVFKRSMWRQGILRARYNHERLSEHLKRIIGEETTLEDSILKTGLLIVTKRLDTGSPWPVSNNPRGAFFESAPEDTWLANKDFLLWKVVRASTAAPSFFDPEVLAVGKDDNGNVENGSFVDGGVSPFNNPSLQALMFATLAGYNLNWDTGTERLSMVAVGTGRADPSKTPSWSAASGAIQSLLSLMDDNATLVETMMQWLSKGDTHREIDADIGTVLHDSVGREASLAYTRYDLPLTRDTIDSLKPSNGIQNIEDLTDMDEPKNMRLLLELARADALEKVRNEHFRPTFDLC